MLGGSVGRFIFILRVPGELVGMRGDSVVSGKELVEGVIGNWSKGKKNG